MERGWGLRTPTERHVVTDDESVDATLTEDSAEDTQAEVDWQKRYTDTQAEYTRNQQALAEERKVWEDEQALLARVQEKFPHLLAEEEEETGDEDGFEDEDDSEIAQLRAENKQFKEWQQTVEAERRAGNFTRDLNQALDGQEVSQQVKDWIYARTIALGDGPKNLAKAVEEFQAITGELGQKKKPRAPHVPKTGSAGDGVKDFSQMSRSEINDYMVERARALEAQ